MSTDYDLVVIGMGPGGAAAAEYACSLGRKVAVVERDRVGGSCLWTGCMPSKSLVTSARAAHAVRRAAAFGVHASGTRIDLPAIWRRIRSLQAEIAATEQSPLRYAEMGIDVVRGDATVTGSHTVEVNGSRRLEARFVLICTGSHPVLPDIPGFDRGRLITPGDLFQLGAPPETVCVLGDDAVAVELAQSLARLGIGTTLACEPAGPLAGQEPALVDLLVRRLADDGVEVITSTRLIEIGGDAGGETATLAAPGGARTVRAARIVAAGRRAPNLDGLGLSELGVRIGGRGIEVDHRGRSSVPSVYAAGDVAGHDGLAHIARHDALTATQDMFGGRSAREVVTTRCVFADPELASAGLTSVEAVARFGPDSVDVHHVDLASSLRARVDGIHDGAVVLVTAGRRIVGAHVLSPSAGEMIHGFALAIGHRMSLDDLTGVVQASPTLTSSLERLSPGSAATTTRDRRRHPIRRRRSA